MIHKFGQVMIYVKDPRKCADFWKNKIGFTEIQENKGETGILSVELAPNSSSDASIVLFDREVVKKFSPELSLQTPSILFSSYNIKEMHDRLIKEGVTVGEIADNSNQKTFNFSDVEGNYFAVREIPL